MKNLKTYTFKITTVKIEEDPKSPHTIAFFEFQAEDKAKALEYMFNPLCI